MSLTTSSGVDRGRLFIRYAAWALPVLASFIVVLRTWSFNPAEGDIAVWAFVHEWLGRGAPLYAGVWDHKDFGFFLLTQPFYALGGINGLYFAGLMAVALLAIGVYLLVRTTLSPHAAIVVASVAAAAYACAPSFLATYTENLSIALAVLGVGLLLRHPILAGIALGVSCAIKISGLALVLVILIADGALALRSRRQRLSASTGYGSLLLVALFTALTLGVFLAVAFVRGSAAGWLDVISYNSEYAAIRRDTLPPLSDPRVAWAVLSPGLSTLLFVAMCFTSCLALMALLAHIVRLHSSKTRFGEQWRAVYLTGSLAVATFLVVMAQFPPRFQHYQYLVGALLALSSVLFGLLWQQGRHRTRTRQLAVAALVLPLVFGAGILLRGTPQMEPARFGEMWGLGSEDGEPISALEGLTGSPKLAFVNLGGFLVSGTTIPPDAVLTCPFFYQYSHLLPRYSKDILQCLESSPDYVVVRTSGYSPEDWIEQVRSTLSSQFIQCESSDPVYELWARSPIACPVDANDRSHL